MINLSERARDLGYYSILSLLKRLRDPDIFLATDVHDFLKDRRSIEIPWYKKGSFERIYVIQHNVKIRKIDGEDKFFILEDQSGAFVAYWYNSDWFPAAHSYQETIEANGLTEQDQLHKVFFRYLLRDDLPSICEVIPHKFAEITEEPMSLLDRLGVSVTVQDLLPQIV